MLAALSDCWINEPISSQFAIQRLDRPTPAPGSNSRVGGVGVGRIPNLRIGRYRNIIYRFGTKQPVIGQLKLLADVRRLVDCRKFTLLLFGISNNVKKNAEAHLPIVLPKHLQEFHVKNMDCEIGLADFVLPSSLIRIKFESRYNDKRVGCVSRLKWPDEPSHLKEFIGMAITSPLKQSFSLPNGLTTVSFLEPLPFFPITNVIFQNTIVNLELPVWHDHHGRYREIVFPSALKRLVFTCEVDVDDLDFNKWVHLPVSCVNIELRLRKEKPSSNIFDALDEHHLSSSIILVTPYVQQLRIRRLCSSSWELPQLQLSNATSLTALVTDSLERIDWPSDSSIGLKSLKTNVEGRQFLAAVLPTTLLHLDLSDVLIWDSDVSLYDYRSFHTLFPSLIQIDAPVSGSTKKLYDFSKGLPNCYVNGQSLRPSKNASGSRCDVWQLHQLLNGVEVHPPSTTKWEPYRRELIERFDSTPIATDVE